MFKVMKITKRYLAAYQSTLAAPWAADHSEELSSIQKDNQQHWQVPEELSSLPEELSSIMGKVDHPVRNAGEEDGLEQIPGYLYAALSQCKWHCGVHACSPLSVQHLGQNKNDHRD